MGSKISISTLAKSGALTGAVMVICFTLALLMANIPSIAELYAQFVIFPLSFGMGDHIYSTTLIGLVNDGFMTLFFLLIGLELKYHLSLGEYQEKRALILPAMAAIGGVVVPAFIYMLFNYGLPTARGWAIPIATDTAFMLGILSFFGRYISSKLRAFVISFSLIDDALALAILALFYTTSLNIFAFWVASGLLILLLILNRLQIQYAGYYLIVGVFLWIAMVHAGIHGTMCGAILALTIPVNIEGKLNSSFRNLETTLRPIVNYYVIPLFIFINSGIKLDILTFEILTSHMSLGIILGLFIGKPVGIALFSAFAFYRQWCPFPQHTTWSRFYSICVLGGIGFTLSLFIGDLSFSSTPNYEMRSAVILGSLLSAFFGTGLLYYSIRYKSSSPVEIVMSREIESLNMATTKQPKSELLSLRNVGRAVCRDLHLLGITEIKQLKSRTADELYTELQRITGIKQDPCVWDVFAAIIHEANTGEKVPWWHFSKIRKGKSSTNTLK